MLSHRPTRHKIRTLARAVEAQVRTNSPTPPWALRLPPDGETCLMPEGDRVRTEEYIRECRGKNYTFGIVDNQGNLLQPGADVLTFLQSQLQPEANHAEAEAA